MRKINWGNFINDVLKYMVAIGGFCLLMMVLFGTRTETKINQFYNIATNCLVAKAPPRSKAYAKYCYDKAQDISGIDAERFGEYEGT